jgi:hypothetical protein
MYLRCWLSNIPDFLLEFHRNVFTQDQTAFKSDLNLWSRTQVSCSRMWPSFVSWSNLAHNKRFSSRSVQPGLKLWNFQLNLSSFVFETLCWSTKCICPCPCVPSPNLSCQKTDLTKMSSSENQCCCYIDACLLLMLKPWSVPLSKRKQMRVILFQEINGVDDLSDCRSPTLIIESFWNLLLECHLPMTTE